MRTRSSITGLGTLLRSAGLPQALIKIDGAGIALVGLVIAGVGDRGVDVANVDGHVLAEIGQRHRGADAGVAGDNDAQRLHVADAGGRHQDAQFLAFLDAAFQGGRPDHADDAPDLVGSGAKLAQNRTDRLALFDDDLALAPVAAAIDLIGRLRRQRDVLGNDARREAEIIVAVVLGGVIEFQARRPGGVGKETFSHSDVAATSRTWLSTSSIGNCVAGLTFASRELRSHTAGDTA